MTFQHQYSWKHEAMVKLVRLFCERGPTACCAQVWLNTNGNLFIFSEGVANIPQFKSYSLIQWLAYSIANCVGTFLALVFLLKYFENQSFSSFMRKKSTRRFEPRWSLIDLHSVCLLVRLSFYIVSPLGPQISCQGWPRAGPRSSEGRQRVPSGASPSFLRERGSATSYRLFRIYGADGGFYVMSYFRAKLEFPWWKYQDVCILWQRIQNLTRNRKIT